MNPSEALLETKDMIIKAAEDAVDGWVSRDTRQEVKKAVSRAIRRAMDRAVSSLERKEEGKALRAKREKRTALWGEKHPGRCYECGSWPDGGGGNHHGVRGRTCACCGKYVRGDSLG